ncbi:surfactin synthetase [Vibrio zhanjiangensis]|uniref:Surfactin synthetase n=1 Tax=Vibrio zhanjiangensis TaxID=1046128 RepID=A0ABQ6EY08_9VIBR|nr:AMP-binding protein [Vibrio zhanjiangensis]GLT18067.1 surfactin synthetase [Vibrio zhanjiangensis]
MNTGLLNISSIATLMTANRTVQSRVAYDKNITMTWEAFQDNVASLKVRLENHQAQRIALCFGNSYLFAISFFACCYSGKSIVLPGNCQPEALRELDKHFDLVLHDREVIPPNGLSSLYVDICSNSGACKWQTLSLADITLTLFTSGSSGNPKAVRKTLEQLDIEITILNRLWGHKLQGANIESTVSHQHIYGLLFRVLWPLCSETPFATYNLEFPEQVCHFASPETVLISSPALLRRLSKELQPSSLRCTFSSGGPLPINSAYHVEQLFGDYPIEVLGSTETGGIAYRQQSSVNQLWTLFPEIEASLNDKNCLKLRSAHIDKTQWYQTADECYFHENGCFELYGRTDRVVKVEEKRVSLVEVEKRLEQLSLVEEGAVIPVREADRLSLFAAIVLTTEGNEVLKELGKGKFWIALRKALLKWLEPAAIPRKFRVLDEIPLNSQGKRHPSEIEKLFQE